MGRGKEGSGKRGVKARASADGGSAARRPPARQVFRTRDVARVLAVKRQWVYSCVRRGLCRPGRRGRWYEFSFQDLVILRTALGLMRSDVSPRRVRRALREFRIGGLKTSIPFHQQIMESAEFMWGAFDTNFLDRFDITYAEQPQLELSAAIAAALIVHNRESEATTIQQPCGQGSGSAWKRATSWKR